MAAQWTKRGEAQAGVWLAVLINAGCAKGTEATQANPAQPVLATGAKTTAPGASEVSPARAPQPYVPEPVEAPPPAHDGDPPLTLLVSNQSASVREVDIQVRIDGRRLVDDTFSLDMGHTVKRYTFQLAKGPHELRATADGGAAHYEGSIDMQAERWGALFFWRSPKSGAGEQPPAFTFELQDSPIQLR